MTERLLTIDEVCDQLRVSPNWVYARAASGQLPSAIIGGRRKFRQADVDAYVEQHMTRPAEPPRRIRAAG